MIPFFIVNVHARTHTHL